MTWDLLKLIVFIWLALLIVVVALLARRKDRPQPPRPVVTVEDLARGLDEAERYANSGGA